MKGNLSPDKEIFWKKKYFKDYEIFDIMYSKQKQKKILNSFHVNDIENKFTF